MLEIRKILFFSPAADAAKCYIVEKIDAESKILVRRKSTVAFSLGNRKFITTSDGWRNRKQGYIEAIESRKL